MIQLTAIAIGGLFSSALLAALHYALGDRLKAPGAYVAYATALNCGATIGAVWISCPSAALLPWSVSALGAGTLYTLRWIDARIAEIEQGAFDAGSAAAPPPLDPAAPGAIGLALLHRDGSEETRGPQTYRRPDRRAGARSGGALDGRARRRGALRAPPSAPRC